MSNFIIIKSKRFNLILILLFGVLLFSCKQHKRSMIINQLKDVAKLATTEIKIEKVVMAKKDKKILGIFKANQAVFFANTEATIKTGIDLNKIKPGDITIKGKMVSLKLPHVEVINFSYPADKFKINHYITEDAFLNKFTIEDQERLYRQAELNIRNNLEYMGIKEATEEKTRLMMEGLLKNLGYNEIYIEFKEDGKLIQEIDINEAQN